MLKYQQIKLTYVVPVYLERNLDVFHSLLDVYGAYKPEVLRHIHFIFINDCSPIKISIPEDCKLNYTLAEITTDIKWNQGGARNLGVHLARSQKLVVTDLDHVFPEAVFKFLIESKVPENIFKFKRERDNAENKPHFNTFFLSKSTYFKSLGVDEEFCGHYGYEDAFFVIFQQRLGTKVLTYKNKTIFSHEHKLSDKAHHKLSRDLKPKKQLYKAKRAILLDKNRDPFDAHSRLFLNFDWHIENEQIKL
ncbi:hypothetical protein [Winogradskyella sp. 3972H.M.0a.05]|uniref:hypothetical protein n=1 Tax=Winogradskyella sp. 3972H.M.0a.05 TaxID=2950277 RepID=UPI003398E7B9